MRSFNVLLLAVVLVGLQGCAAISNISSADRRSAGTQVEDDTIETTAMTRIHAKFKDTTAQVMVTCYNRFVLITGDVTTKEAKTNIERIIYSVPNVKKISNEVSVGGLTNSSIRRTDLGITKDIKSDLNLNKTIQAGTIKVTTDKGVVYLLGLVTHAEARVAAEIASSIIGVQKVMRVFEYIDQAE